MPTPKKLPARRQRRNKCWGPALVSDAQAGVPEPPRELLQVTRRLWENYWTSPLIAAVEPATDLPAIQRMFTLYDERERAYRAYRKERLVKGSQGQMVINPLAKQMTAMDSEIRQLEDRLGLTPKSRAQLGITFGAVQRTIEDLNRDTEADWDDDPRLEEVVGEGL